MIFLKVFNIAHPAPLPANRWQQGFPVYAGAMIMMFLI